MKVHIPTPLQSYTAHQGVVDAGDATIGEMLTKLDRRHPGRRFRIIDEQDAIRRHIKLFINEDQVRTLSDQTRPEDTVHIICALSGG